jgi:septal ring factor EnvC (AmiA/AmiB activator)
MTEQKRKTEQEKLADLAQKIEQLQARKTALEKKVKADERKRRTKRLIEIGAIVEAYAGEITDLNELKTYLEKYGANIAKTQPPKKKLITIKARPNIMDVLLLLSAK